MLMSKKSIFAIIITLLLHIQVFAADWPQWRGVNRDGIWREKGIVEKFQHKQLPIRWCAKIANGYSGPAVAKGRVYITDRLTSPNEIERVHCFDAMTGMEIWSHIYESNYIKVGYPNGPRASVTINDGRAYSLGSMGHIFSFDAAKGNILWSRDLYNEYKIRKPVWGIAASPLVEKNLVIVQIGGADNACLVAFDKVSGQEKWRALNDKASYSAPIIIEQAGKRVLVCWTGDSVAGFDPMTGKLCWQHPFVPVRMVLNIATPVFENGYLFVSGFYDGSLLLKVNPDELSVEQVWRRRGQSEKITDSLHCCISTAVLQGDYIYGVDSYGQIRCLDMKTGDRIWESLDATPNERWSNIHMVRNEDKIWMFNERGELIISKLSPEGFHQISRAKLIQPTTGQLSRRGQGVCWSHPAFANKHIYIRNDQELVCADLSLKK